MPSLRPLHTLRWMNGRRDEWIHGMQQECRKAVLRIQSEFRPSSPLFSPSIDIICLLRELQTCKEGWVEVSQSVIPSIRPSLSLVPPTHPLPFLRSREPLPGTFPLPRRSGGTDSTPLCPFPVSEPTHSFLLEPTEGDPEGSWLSPFSAFPPCLWTHPPFSAFLSFPESS